MKRFSIVIFFLSFYHTFGVAQDYINITFRHYPIGQNVVRAFVPGTFNNWGPNSNGLIAANAPSLMTYIDSLGWYVKTTRLKVGDTHNYKFHEHWNNSGNPPHWFTDPLNPLINYSDNNNSILQVGKTMIFEILPKNNTVITQLQPQLVAGVFSRESDPILLDQSQISLDGKVIDTFQDHVIPALSILDYKLPVLSNGVHKVIMRIVTQKGEIKSDSTLFNVQVLSPVIKELPRGIVDGVNYINETTATLSLYAPNKQFVHVIGDFNDWKVDSAYFMYLTPDRSRFWLTISGLQPNQEYVYQYLVNGDLKIADPYAEKILDPGNDQFISHITYPGLIPYPRNKTTEIASVLQTNQPEYHWQVPDFQRPLPQDLIIYELLVRDFIAEHDYDTLIDTLGYLKRLGVNAIELMPINEFEGNESWGYNPSFYFAPDKYYGPLNDLKRFIDEAHNRGMTVIQDVVLNHAYGECSLVRLYLDNMSLSPWFNEQAPHTDYSWGYDFNHEKQATKDFVDRFTSYWLTEYHIDGFRFDFTRGFTNKYGPSGARDASRIAILKRIYDHIRSVDSTAYMILEHLIDDESEKKELADYGMLLWENMNTAYSQSAMGWLEDSQRWSDLSRGYFKTRRWTKPHLLTYMESHDEPWLMYKNLLYGRSSGNYDIKNLSSALDRIKLVAAFFFTIPGPKMMWQFGELGYDQELPESGYARTAPKPILWNYYHEAKRKQLYETIAALVKLRQENAIFRDPQSDVQMIVGQGQYGRRINLSNDSMNVAIIGNFHVIPIYLNPNFQKTGKWYDYFSGDSITVADTLVLIALDPGEFHIYTDKKVATPDTTTAIEPGTDSKETSFTLKQNYPNPFNSRTLICYSLSEPNLIPTTIKILNILGQEINVLVNENQTAGTYQTMWDGKDTGGNLVASGVYLYSIKSGKYSQLKKMILLR